MACPDRRVVINEGVHMTAAAKRSQPLDGVMPVQHGSEKALLVLFLLRQTKCPQSD
jgi:hypothetical protein